MDGLMADCPRWKRWLPDAGSSPVHCDKSGLCLQTAPANICEGGHRRLKMSSFLSWEEAAKVSCPFSPLSMYPAGLAWWVVSVQTEVDTER